MDVESIRHKALKRFFVTGNPRGLDAEIVDRLRKMLVYLNAVGDPDELHIPPNYNAHQLTGDRTGVWALTVTRNWRMTFTINATDAIIDLNLEDYH